MKHDNPSAVAAISDDPHFGVHREDAIPAERARVIQTPRRRGAPFYDAILWRAIPQDLSLRESGYLLGITGGERGVGTSTVAANVAIRAADHGMGPVLLVDANFMRPRLDRTFRVRGAFGFVDLLSGECDLADAVHTTTVEELHILPNGTPSLVDRLAADPQRMDSILTELQDQFRIVIFDLEEASRLCQSLPFARRMDSSLMVLRGGGTSRKAARQSASQLASDSVSLDGVVMTHSQRRLPAWLRRWL